MDQKVTEFTRDVENLIRCAREDTTDAICSIARTQHSFDTAAAGLRERVVQIPQPATCRPQLQTASRTTGRRVSRRELGMVWLVAMGAALLAFVFGYVLGLPPDQRFRSRSR
ncbi:hypothetical protein [uncultured Paludibaculum sp.]|uniref:hypothetical protein n=1 Tax=uncultured Paludibaculum sp. TaxID=1765020 RepID=UPI002AAA8830|nr:hypothetical protein [uncultured Paludibaculum sp.]